MKLKSLDDYLTHAVEVLTVDCGVKGLRRVTVAQMFRQCGPMFKVAAQEKWPVCGVVTHSNLAVALSMAPNAESIQKARSCFYAMMLDAKPVLSPEALQRFACKVFPGVPGETDPVIDHGFIPELKLVDGTCIGSDKGRDFPEDEINQDLVDATALAFREGRQRTPKTMAKEVGSEFPITKPNPEIFVNLRQGEGGQLVPLEDEPFLPELPKMMNLAEIYNAALLVVQVELELPEFLAQDLRRSFSSVGDIFERACLCDWNADNAKDGLLDIALRTIPNPELHRRARNYFLAILRSLKGRAIPEDSYRCMAISVFPWRIGEVKTFAPTKFFPKHTAAGPAPSADAIESGTNFGEFGEPVIAINKGLNILADTDVTIGSVCERASEVLIVECGKLIEPRQLAEQMHLIEKPIDPEDGIDHKEIIFTEEDYLRGAQFFERLVKDCGFKTKNTQNLSDEERADVLSEYVFTETPEEYCDNCYGKKHPKEVCGDGLGSFYSYGNIYRRFAQSANTHLSNKVFSQDIPKILGVFPPDYNSSKVPSIEQSLSMLKSAADYLGNVGISIALQEQMKEEFDITPPPKPWISSEQEAELREQSLELEPCVRGFSFDGRESRELVLAVRLLGLNVFRSMESDANPKSGKESILIALELIELSSGFHCQTLESEGNDCPPLKVSLDFGTSKYTDAVS